MHAYLTISALQFGVTQCLANGHSIMGELVLEGFIREDGQFEVAKIVDDIGCEDPRVKRNRRFGQSHVEVMENIALQHAKASAEVYGGVHLLTFNGEIVF